MSTSLDQTALGKWPNFILTNATFFQKFVSPKIHSITHGLSHGNPTITRTRAWCGLFPTVENLTVAILVVPQKDGGPPTPAHIKCPAVECFELAPAELERVSLSSPVWYWTPLLLFRLSPPPRLLSSPSCSRELLLRICLVPLEKHPLTIGVLSRFLFAFLRSLSVVLLRALLPCLFQFCIVFKSLRSMFAGNYLRDWFTAVAEVVQLTLFPFKAPVPRLPRESPAADRSPRSSRWRSPFFVPCQVLHTERLVSRACFFACFSLL